MTQSKELDAVGSFSRAGPRAPGAATELFGQRGGERSGLGGPVPRGAAPQGPRPGSSSWGQPAINCPRGPRVLAASGDGDGGRPGLLAAYGLTEAELQARGEVAVSAIERRRVRRRLDAERRAESSE